MHNSALAVKAAFRYLRIAVALVCFWSGYYLCFAAGHSSDPPAVRIMGGAGVVVFGVFLLNWNTRRAWVAYTLPGAMLALLPGWEAYEVAIGERNWSRLWMTVAFFLMLLFGGPLCRRLTGGSALRAPTKE